MAITPKLYGQGVLKSVNGAIDWDTDTFKMMLATSSYVPNQDTHDFRDDVTNEVATANGYTGGGVTLATVTSTYDSVSQQIRYDFVDPAWTFTAAVSWQYAVVYKSRGGLSSADELLGYLDWGTTQTVSTAYTLQIATTGCFYIDVT